jgi:dienelactone hydrolase
MKILLALLALVCLPARIVWAQSEPAQLEPILKEEIVSPDVSLFQLKEYILSRVSKPPAPASLQEWKTESQRLREHLLKDVVFHGWPKDWVTTPPRFEDLGVIESDKGYRMRKLRYEIVPGFQSTAILYEPEKLQGKIPAILNVNGHVGPIGKAVEYKQKRCINFAKRGILALSLEWLAFGELTHPENLHLFGGHLDMVGANELGLFVLAMRRGLDYLYDHPNTDRERLGMTGLSGGAWQTILLSSLDERVRVAVPIAGFTSLQTRVEVRDYGDLGDVEQSGTDLLDGQDYSHLAALLAPRPSLFGFNAEDNCCFRAPLVKSLIYDAVQPIYRLYGKEADFEWHENRDPGTHNYQLDHRLQAYRFFSRHFNLPPIENEIASDSEIKSYEELVVGLPKNNLTVLELARKLAAEIKRPPIPGDPKGREAWASTERIKLQKLIRYKPVKMERVWTVANTKNKGVETLSYQFGMDNKLNAEGVWLKSIEASAKTPATLVLNDRGKQESALDVSDRVNRGEQVLAFDPLFTGSAWRIKTPATPERETGPWAYIQFIHATGDRALGMEAAQLVETAKWLGGQTGIQKVRLESRGLRNQVAALVASALEPELFSEVVIRDGIQSLGYLLEKPVEYQQAAELFCLDFYKEFDLDRLVAMAGTTKIVHQ